VAGIDLKTRFRHYVNIDRMESRLNELLGDFRWGRMDDIFLNDNDVMQVPHESGTDRSVAHS
jgi:hypothetical protein